MKFTVANLIRYSAKRKVTLFGGGAAARLCGKLGKMPAEWTRTNCGQHIICLFCIEISLTTKLMKYSDHRGYFNH